ncbi:MAG: hypothetical protein K6G51_00355 [Sphaerochaetaceae bacterium]|nr:hypothetical protein [Sphaerochaetaceae bacterium]
MPSKEEYLDQLLIAEEEDRRDRKILVFLLSMIIMGIIYITILSTMMLL